MTDHDDIPAPDETPLPESVRTEGDDVAPSGPRRSASAQFIVDSSVGSDVALREAMDPANQSLAEALRLSYRVLQVVILVLIVLFIFSGWKQVDDGQTGVLTVWGRIVEVNESGALTPGLKFSKWPYPAGEFILFQEENRPVNSDRMSTNPPDRAFWPAYRRDQSFESAVAASTINQQLKPGRDGSLITRDRELAHAQMTGRYAIADPVRFIKRVAEADADRLVELALRRAGVHRVVELSVEELTDETEALASSVRSEAQELLNAIECGITIQSLHIPRATAPFPIIKTMEELSLATEEVNGTLERARQEANETLTAVVGGELAMDGELARRGMKRYDELELLIDIYEEAIERGDPTAERAELKKIDSVLEDDGTTGEVARIISFAESYQSQIESTLGNETRLFLSLLPTFRRQPNIVINRLWLETYAKVLNRNDAEIFYVPPDIASIRLNISGLDRVAEQRRKNALRKKEVERLLQFRNPLRGQIRRADELTRSGAAGRQLEKTESGGVRARGSGG